jgi:hypothetical protein
LAEEHNNEEEKLEITEEKSEEEQDSDLGEQEDKEEGKLAFTPEGEDLGYVSLDQARVLAVQHSRDNRDYYGPAYARRELVWEVISAEESEDYYDVRLSYRIAGTTRGKPGIEQFTIDKVGAIVLRQILNRPSKQWVPVVLVSFLSLGLVTAGAVVYLFAVGAISSEDILQMTGAAGGIGPTPTITSTSVTGSETEEPLSPEEIQELIAKALSDAAVSDSSSNQLDPDDIVASILESIRSEEGLELKSEDIEQLVVQAVAEDTVEEQVPAPLGVMAATPTPTATPIPTQIPTLIPTPTPTPTSTPNPTATPEPTLIPTPRPTVTPIATATPTPIPTPTVWPTPTSRPLPTLWPDSQPDASTYSARNHYDDGVRYYKAGDCRLAIEQFSVAIEVDPTYFNPHSWRAHCYRKLGYYELAIEDYDWVILTRAENASVYNSRGRSYRDLGQYLRAIQDYDKAIEIDPNHISAYNNRGFAYHLLDKYQRAIQDYDKAIEIDPQATYYYNRATAYRAIGQYAEANEDKAKACSLDSQYC